MEDEPVLIERRGAVAVLTLNRPDKRNAMNRAMSARLAELVEELEADDAINVIVLTGAGDKAFCAGADMGEALERQNQPASQVQSAGGRNLNGAASIARASKPVIAAVNGFAYGLGAQLAISTDIRIASPEAKFRFVGASYGLVVSGVDLPRLVGPAVAKELLFTTRVVEAGEAEKLGLVNHVVAQEGLLASAVEMAEQVAANSPLAVRWAKKVIDAASTIQEARQIEAEASALRGSSDQSARFRVAAERIVGPSA